MDRRAPSNAVIPFLLTEGALYAFFLFLDAAGGSEAAVPVKYAGILLCLAFSLLCAARGGDRLAPLALALTACADWFLLVRGGRYALGVALFLCVQAVYLLRLRRAGAPSAWFLRSSLALLGGLAVCAAGMASPLNLLAALYFSQLLSNTALAWTRRGTRWRIFALGLTLFIGCDACVGLFNVLPPSSPLFPAVSIGMWLFYLPSQVLIALSALPGKEALHGQNQ